MGSHSLLQGIFPTEGLNLCLLHCRCILYCLNHKVSPIVVEFGLRCLEAGGILLTQGLNQGLLRRQVDSLPLSHQGWYQDDFFFFFAVKEEYALRIVRFSLEMRNCPKPSPD